ncbi:hypothetical protein ATQ66_22850, partial [Salmonella enterica]|nr:hypothetical protein [Salmonella enterica]EAX3267904.1 hypothetical protein [Salmonella enterica]EBS8291278.1 hypothetical protein [Salmonella enterica]EBS8489155.1 hypothetical protein [Salmonella enterica]
KVIEIYKTCVEMADRISDRRLKSNTFLLALNSSILPLVGYFSLKPAIQPIWVILISLAGIVINVYWINLITSYKRINTAKFTVIQEMEVKIGVTPFKREEEVITKERHRHLSDIEKMLPITLIAIHFLIIIMMTFFYTPKVQENSTTIINIISSHL